MRNISDAWQLEYDRTQVLRLVVQEWTRSVAKQRLGELFGNDQTLAGLRPVATGTLLEVTGRWGPVSGPTL